jgi:thiol-disulfide isomerase/thioredoxin
MLSIKTVVLCLVLVTMEKKVAIYFSWSPTVSLVLQAILIVVGLNLAKRGGAQSGGEASSLIGTPAAKLGSDLVFVQGERVEIKPGIITVIELWATWCPPCRTAIPHVNKLYKKLKAEGAPIQFVGITNEVGLTAFCFVLFCFVSRLQWCLSFRVSLVCVFLTFA